MPAILLLLIFILCSSPDLEASTQPIGTLQLEKGIIRIRQSGVDTMHSEQGKILPVYNGDEFQTGLITFVRIKLNGSGDDIELSSQTFFRLSNISAEGQELSMPVGKATFNVKKPRIKGRKRRFRIKTANALINIKGSIVRAASLDGVTGVFTLSGSATLESLDEPEVVVEINVGQASQASVGETPDDAFVVPPEVIKTIMDPDNQDSLTVVIFGIELDVKIEKPAEVLETLDTTLDELEKEIDDAIDAAADAKIKLIIKNP